ncbi:hypothetical protein HPB50_003039 [Hyalomma asiaticum]|uniref:Uncharacterized protein n=1 Tax=Hyalomma asiaticum TaxID=266040 RepID=A0ACB7SDY0_HYAAI|nr:hypothetical protein HPB50_003039 [Hyalomma asiaticum]
MYVHCRIASLAQAVVKNTRQTTPALRNVSSVGTLTLQATDHARNVSSMATVVRLVHDRDCSSIRSSSSRRSPSPQSKMATVPAGAKVLDEVNLEARTSGPNMER